MKAHSLKHQKKGHEKRTKRAAKALVRKQLAGSVKTQAATLSGMRKMIEQLGVPAVDAALGSDMA